MAEYHLKTKEVCQSSKPVFSSGGIAEALRSVASAETWSVQGVFLQTASLFSVDDQKPLPNHPDSPILVSGPDEDKRYMEKTQEKIQEELFEVKFESKYVNSSVPLYQEYWLKCMKTELQKVQQKIFVDVLLAQRPCAPNPSALTPTSTQTPASVSSPPSVQVAPYALWQELPEVKRLNLVRTLETREVQLQEAMFELIVSEASYQKSLRVAVGHFQCSTELKQTLTPGQNHVLFSNLKEVFRASEGFLFDLETRLGQNVVMSKVGDVVLSHQSVFRRVYVPYVTNMMYQETLIAKLIQENKKFVLALKKLEKNPLCQTQTLKSFLILPFQRITRLRLILENILKRTDNHSIDIPNLKEAIKAVQEIVVECDGNVQRMKQTEELVGLGKLMDFVNVKTIPLIVSGRYLIRAGPLKKFTVKKDSASTVSRADIYMHLFNDLLLLSLKNGNKFTVQDHAVFPAHVHVEEVKIKMFGLPSDAFLLHLTKNHSTAATVLVLAAHTRAHHVIPLYAGWKETPGFNFYLHRTAQRVFEQQ